MRKSRWSVSAAFFINGFLLSNYIARLPHIQSKYSIDYQQLGFVLLASAIGSLLAMPFTGALIQRYGSKLITFLALAGLCITVAFFILAPHYELLLLMFFTIGTMSGVTDVAMNAQAVVVEKAYGRSIMSSFHGIWSLGLFAGAGIGTLFIAFDISLFNHFCAIATIALISLIYSFQYFVEDEVTDHSDQPVFRLPNKFLVGIGIIAFCAMLGEGAMADWSAIYMKDVMGLDDRVATSGLVAYSLAMLTARFLGDRVRTQIGDARMIQVSSVFSLVGMLLIILAWHVGISLVGFVLAGLGLATIVPITYSRAGNTPGIPPGVGISMVTTIGYSGFIIGPPIIGFIAKWQTLPLAFSFVIGLFILMLILSFRIVD